MPPVRGKKVTPEEQRIAKAIKDIEDGTHKSTATVTDPFWTVTVDIALDSLRTHTGTQTWH